MWAFKNFGKIEKNRNKKFFMTLPRLHQTELFLFNLNSLVRSPTHRLSHPLNSHPIYRLMLIFYVLLKHRKVVPMNNKKQANFYFRYIYLFVSGGQRKVNFIFGELLRLRLIFPSRCVLKSILRPPLKNKNKPKTFPVIGFLLSLSNKKWKRKLRGGRAQRAHFPISKLVFMRQPLSRAHAKTSRRRDQRV